MENKDKRALSLRDSHCHDQLTERSPKTRNQTRKGFSISWYSTDKSERRGYWEVHSDDHAMVDMSLPSDDVAVGMPQELRDKIREAFKEQNIDYAYILGIACFPFVTKFHELD